MLATYAMIAIIIAHYMWRQSYWWTSTVLGSESTLSCMYPWYGDNLFYYYKHMTAPLSAYIFSVTLRRSIPRARQVYNAMLSAQGFFLFLAASVLFDSEWVGLVTGTCFLLYTFVPNTFVLEMEPEAHGYFFASLGIMLTAYGLHYAMPWLVYLGVFCGSLSFHCKITLQDGLMTLAVIGCMHGVDALFWKACLVYLGSGFLFVSLVALTALFPHDNDSRAFHIPSLCGRIGVIFRAVKDDLGIRYVKDATSPINDFLAFYLGYHAQIAWPLVVMTVAAVYQGLLSPEQVTLIVILTALPIGQCMARLNYQPVYAFMVHFPLGLGAGVFLQGNAATLWEHPVATLLVFGVALYGIMLVLKKRDQITDFKAKTRVIKEHVLDPIRAAVTPSDYVFQDSWMVFVYLELGCKSPNMNFLWADRIQLVLKRQADVDGFIRYFTDNKPKYFIAHQKQINLTYLETVTGLRYELRNTVYAYVYERISVEKPSGERVDFKLLFGNAAHRYAQDAYEKRWMENMI